MNWRRNSARGIPSPLNTAGDALRRDAGPLRPFGDAQRFGAHRYQVVVAAVAILFCLCSPTTVVWLVSSSVVFAIDGRSLRSAPHVVVEVGEAPPASADANACAPVTRVGVAFRVRASRNDAGPDDVFGRPALANRCAMLNEAVTSPASATSVLSCCQSRGGGEDGLSAFASAGPDDRAAGPLGGRRQGSQEAEDLSGEVSCSCRPLMVASYGGDLVLDEAPAATGVASAEPRRITCRRLPAVAPALPLDDFAAVATCDASDLVGDDEAPEPLANQVELFWHASIIRRLLFSPGAAA